MQLPYMKRWDLLLLKLNVFGKFPFEMEYEHKDIGRARHEKPFLL